MFSKFMIVSLLALVSCSSVGQKAQQSAINKKNAEAVLKKGTPQSKVLETLGSPNTVSSEGNGREVWSYLRSASNSGGTGVSGTLFRNSVGYLTDGWFSASASESSRSSQDTTLIVYFDKLKQVTDFTFRSEIH